MHLYIFSSVVCMSSVLFALKTFCGEGTQQKATHDMGPHVCNGCKEGRTGRTMEKLMERQT